MLMVFIIILCSFVIISMVLSSSEKKKRSKSPIVEKSHDWHLPKGEYAQNHADRIDSRLVRHPEPEPGYVVLNGVKRKIEDCRNL